MKEPDPPSRIPVLRCNVCGHPIEDRGGKHAQCRFCGQVSALCCDPELPIELCADARVKEPS